MPVLGLTFFVYAMRRVHCPRCGKVKVERVPWAQGKQQATEAHRQLGQAAVVAVFELGSPRGGMAWGRERVLERSAPPEIAT